jgi:hypothetical protein
MPKKKFPFGEKNLQDLLLLGANDEFKADMKILDKQYNLFSNDGEISGKESLELLQDPKNMEFLKDFLGLMKKFNLSKVFSLLIASIVQNGNFAELAKGGKSNLSAEEIKDILRESSGVKLIDKSDDCYTLRVYRNTTTKDHLKASPEIKNTLGDKNERAKQSQNLERDLYINALKEQGLTAKEIVKKLREKDEFKNEIIGYEEVPKIIKRLKEKAHKNMPDKDS